MPWYRKLHWQIITGHAYPTSLDRAIGGSNNYDADIRHVPTAGHGANDIAGIDQRCSLLVSTQ